MARSTGDSRSKEDSARSILDDWNPTTASDDGDSEPHQAEHDGLSIALNSSFPAPGDADSHSLPLFSWQQFDRSPSRLDPPQASRDVETRQTRAARGLRARRIAPRVERHPGSAAARRV